MLKVKCEQLDLYSTKIDFLGHFWNRFNGTFWYLTVPDPSGSSWDCPRSLRIFGQNGPFYGLCGPRRGLIPGQSVWWPWVQPRRASEGTGGPDLVPLPPIGPPGLDTWSPHTLTWYQAPSGPTEAIKGSVLAQNVPASGAVSKRSSGV